MDINKTADKPNETAVLFKNFSDEEFIGQWDGVKYRFPKGREMFVEAYKAVHFAKHLVDREVQKLTKKNKDGETVYRTVNDPIRRKYEAMALPEGVAQHEVEKQGQGMSSDIVDPSESAMNKNKELEQKAPAEPVAKPVETAESVEPARKSIGQLREIYETLHPEGKQAFNGWKEDELEKRIEAFKKGEVGKDEAGFEGA